MGMHFKFVWYIKMRALTCFKVRKYVSCATDMNWLALRIFFYLFLLRRTTFICIAELEFAT